MQLTKATMNGSYKWKYSWCSLLAAINSVLMNGVWSNNLFCERETFGSKRDLMVQPDTNVFTLKHSTLMPLAMLWESVWGALTLARGGVVGVGVHTFDGWRRRLSAGRRHGFWNCRESNKKGLQRREDGSELAGFNISPVLATQQCQEFATRLYGTAAILKQTLE